MNKRKAVVLKTKEKYMYVATEDRQFLSLPKPSKNVVPGEKVMVNPNIKPKYNYKLAAFAAAIFLMIITGSIYSIISPVEKASAYISVDMNPSLELAVDSDNKVMQITPFNEEADQLKQEMDSEELDFKTALANLIAKAEALGYVSQDIENLIFITIVSIDDDEEIVEIKYQNIRQDIFTTLELVELPGSVAIQKGSIEDRKTAQDQNRSVNEFILKDKLTKKDDITKWPFNELRGKELINKLEDKGIPKDELFDELAQMRGKAGQQPDLPHNLEPGNLEPEKQPFDSPIGPPTDPPGLQKEPGESTQDEIRPPGLKNEDDNAQNAQGASENGRPNNKPPDNHPTDDNENPSKD